MRSKRRHALQGMGDRWLNKGKKSREVSEREQSFREKTDGEEKENAKRVNFFFFSMIGGRGRWVQHGGRGLVGIKREMT